MCELYHTQRNENGEPDHAGNWLMGGPAQLRPAYNQPNWAQREPRIAGTPPGTDAQFITLLSTGISRTRKAAESARCRLSACRARMQAVLQLYLKSLGR